MFVVIGILQALGAILNPVHPWDNVAHRRAQVTHAIAVNIVQLMIVAVILAKCTDLLEWVFQGTARYTKRTQTVDTNRTKPDNFAPVSVSPNATKWNNFAPVGVYPGGPNRAIFALPGLFWDT